MSLSLIEELRANAAAHPLDVRLQVLADAANALESQAREIERLTSCQRFESLYHEAERELAALKAHPSGALPAALGRAFITCESGDAGYRVVIKSESLQEAQQVHNWLARLNSPLVSHGAVMDMSVEQSMAISKRGREAIMSASAGGADERAAFEAQPHLGDGLHQARLDRDPSGAYRIPKVNNQWIGWQARSALSAPSHGEHVRDGWQLVPVEPTEEMLEAVTTSKHERLRAEVMRMAATDYRLMLAAAPSAGSQKEQE